MTVATACGKLILFGEHAVVYGRPALAVPLSGIRARARVESANHSRVVIHAQDVGRELVVGQDRDSDPLAVITRLTLARVSRAGGLDIFIESEIPIASGLGSGAAVSTAIVRALAAHAHQTLTASEISDLVFEAEKLYHGTPSGIDNSVIAYEMPVRFARGEPITPFKIARPFTLVIANTGIASPTRLTVGDVRRGWQAEPARYEALFDEVAAIVGEAQDALARGASQRLGGLMERNQNVLERLGVSSPDIRRLLDAGLEAGAAGGKLSGGGRGGNVIFYVEHDAAEEVRCAALDAGAVSVLVTEIKR